MNVLTLKLKRIPNYLRRYSYKPRNSYQRTRKEKIYERSVIGANLAGLALLIVMEIVWIPPAMNMLHNWLVS